MALFSVRKGIRPAEKTLQLDSVDEELRARLWSALKAAIWDNWQEPQRYIGYLADESRALNEMLVSYWLNYFKQPTDTIPNFSSDHPKSAYEILRQYFFECDWWQVYDFIEHTLACAPPRWAEYLAASSNQYLEEENSGYRITGNCVVEISDKQELAEVDSAVSSPYSDVREHLKRSLALLSDRKQPDYRNSIKESISAVESLCRRLSGNNSATLGTALKQLKRSFSIHPALEAALLKLYGYTSDSGGIRHALVEGDGEPTFSDAKFMLVTTSAFVNYVIGKLAEAGE